MEDGSSPRQTFIATTARTADFLLNRDNHGLLNQFWGRENTVSSAAKELKITPNAALYRVRTMLEMGLLEVTRVTPRRGRAITHYTLAANAFYVPFEITRFENKAAFVRAQLEPFFDKLIESEGRPSADDALNGGWGALMSRNAHENITVRPRLRTQIETLAHDAPPTSATFFRYWGTGRLSSERVRGIIARFHEIFHELQTVEDDGPSAKPYLFQMTMQPIEEDLV
jgi:hypothetical protein